MEAGDTEAVYIDNPWGGWWGKPVGGVGGA